MTKAEKQKIEQEIYTKIIDSFSPSLGILQIMQILDTAGIALNKKNAGDDTPYGRIGFGGSNYFEKFFFKTEPQFNPHPPTVDKIVYQPNSPLRRADKDVVEVFVNEVSLYNIFTPLPSNYIELIAKRIKEKDTALSSFLDIFFNIFLSLLFKGWRRQNILYVFEDSLRSGMNPKTPREVVEDYITAFTGLEKTSFDANYEFDNFFTGTNRSGANFVSMLSHYLKNIPVRIENGGGETVKPEFPKLINPNTGEKQWANERGIPFHDEVILADNKQCFILGPMTYEQYLDFHPKKPLLAEVCRLIEDYFQQPHITYTIKMLVTNPPPLKMDGSLTPGFDMWFTDKDTKLVTKEFYPVPREWLVKYEKEQEKLNPLPQKLKGSRYILPEDFAYYIHKLDAPELEKLYQYVIREIGNISEFTTDWVRKNPIAAENSGFNEFGKTTDYELSRLIEFSAFIIAELRQKIDEPPMDYFANTLLEQSNPNLFLPVPALSIVEVNLHSRIKQEEILQRQTQIYLTTNEKKEIPFSTCYTTKLIPAKINRVELFHTYKAKHLNQSKIPLVRNTLEINLECTNNKGFDSLNLNSIRFYINLPRELALCLHEQLFCDLIAVILYDTSEKEEKYLGSIYAPHALDLVGFKEDEIVIPRPFQEEDNHLNTHARHLLYEFGQYPEKFMFFDLKGHKNGLQKTLSTCGKNLQLRFFFKENIHRKIEEILHEQNIFCLNAVPVINLLESDAVEEVITESNKSYEINLPEEQNFYHFKHLNVFNFQTKVRGYCTNVEEHPNPTSFEEPLYTWKKNTENKSVVQNELKSFKIDILNFLGEPINLKGLVLEHKVLSMNYLPLDTILQPGALKGLNSLVKSIVPLQTIISDKQKRFPRLEMWHTLKRVPVTPIYYNENRIEILKSFLRGIHFHEEKHTSNLLNLLLEIKTHVSPGSIAFDYPNDTPAKGANFVFEYDNEKNNDARKNGNLVFLNILSELFADNYSDISFVRLHLKYSKQTESSYCSGFVRGKLSL